MHQTINFPKGVSFATDPPYFDNIGYAELSDFFYGWLRKSIWNVWTELFRRLNSPKEGELVATVHRHQNKDAAEKHFMDGMRSALRGMYRAADNSIPFTIYYAFKQSEVGEAGVTSAGWASFLQALADVGLTIDGTWPIRTELASRMVGRKKTRLRHP
jgi:putative DNA methylase